LSFVLLACSGDKTTAGTSPRLPRLAASDTRANSRAADRFDFSKPLRTFKAVQGPYYRAFFMRQPSDQHICD
jgi:hypothetical protein